MRATSPASIAATVLLGTTLIVGTSGALAQSSPGTATRGVPDPVASGDPGKATPAPLGDVTPAFSNTPTPAFSNTPTPAFSNTPTPAFSNTPTPALPDTPTSRIGSTADGRASGAVAGSVATDGDTPANVSPSGTGTMAVTDDAAVRGRQSGPPASRSASAAPVDGPTDRFGRIGPGVEAGSVVLDSGSRPAANDTAAAFVIVADTPAVTAPATRPMRFTMICNGSSGRPGCKSPPRFIAVEQ